MKSQAETDVQEKEISRLKALIETIERGKLMWEATFDVIADPVVVVNDRFEVVRANRAFASACGRDVRDVIQKKCYEIFAGCTEPCSACPLQGKKENNTRIQLEPFPKNQRQYEVGAFVLSDQSDRSDESDHQCVLYYRDVTDQKRLQQQLVHNEKMAAIGRLAEGVAHEINNPLGAILAFTEIAERAMDITHPCCEDLKEIQLAALRCKKIVRDLLDFSKQASNSQKEKINLTELVQKMMPVIRIATKQAQANVTLQLNENLPFILGDVGRLEQVVLNLVSNATFAMRGKEDGALTISTSTENDKKMVTLQIKDTGTGMDPETQSHIFEPYFTTKQQGEGSGLGLSICNHIVEEHGGRIEVESKEGKGTTIDVVIPVHRE